MGFILNFNKFTIPTRISKRLCSSQPVAGKGGRLCKYVAFCVAFPVIGYLTFNAINRPHPERGEFVPYEYLRRRTKRFPWGDGQKSLFHNPEVNALPDGYETGTEEEVEKS